MTDPFLVLRDGYHAGLREWFCTAYNQIIATPTPATTEQRNTIGDGFTEPSSGVVGLCVRSDEQPVNSNLRIFGH